jgi:hypothetical protein
MTLILVAVLVPRALADAEDGMPLFESPPHQSPTDAAADDSDADRHSGDGGEDIASAPQTPEQSDGVSETGDSTPGGIRPQDPQQINTAQDHTNTAEDPLATAQNQLSSPDGCTNGGCPQRPAIPGAPAAAAVGDDQPGGAGPSADQPSQADLLNRQIELFEEAIRGSPDQSPLDNASPRVLLEVMGMVDKLQRLAERLTPEGSDQARRVAVMQDQLLKAFLQAEQAPGQPSPSSDQARRQLYDQFDAFEQAVRESAARAPGDRTSPFGTAGTGSAGSSPLERPSPHILPVILRDTLRRVQHEEQEELQANPGSARARILADIKRRLQEELSSQQHPMRIVQLSPPLTSPEQQPPEVQPGAGPGTDLGKEQPVTGPAGFPSHKEQYEQLVTGHTKGNVLTPQERELVTGNPGVTAPKLDTRPLVRQQEETQQLSPRLDATTDAVAETGKVATGLGVVGLSLYYLLSLQPELRALLLSLSPDVLKALPWVVPGPPPS